MSSKFPLATLLGVIFATACLPLLSQTNPSANRGGIPLVVGAGYSNFNIDWCCDNREEGATVWADWTITQMPRRFQGLGLEALARDISIDPPYPHIRYDTIGGGAIYHWQHLRNIRPYVKALEEFGAIEFPPPSPGSTYTHDSRTFFAPGGGADFHVAGAIWVRADYEYQIWQNMFGSPHALTPNGVTGGVEYDFGYARPH